MGLGFRVWGLGFTGLGFRVSEMCCGTEAGSYLRLIDSCITQLKAQGPSRTCNESKEEEEDLGGASGLGADGFARCGGGRHDRVRSCSVFEPTPLGEEVSMRL